MRLAYALGDPRLGPSIPDARSASPESLGLAAVQRQEVWTALAHLDPPAQQVLIYRFGLVTGMPYALDEVATLLRLPEAEVRALEADALATLRGVFAAPAIPSA